MEKGNELKREAMEGILTIELLVQQGSDILKSILALKEHLEMTKNKLTGEARDTVSDNKEEVFSNPIRRLDSYHRDTNTAILQSEALISEINEIIGY